MLLCSYGQQKEQLPYSPGMFFLNPVHSGQSRFSAGWMQGPRTTLSEASPVARRWRSCCLLAAAEFVQAAAAASVPAAAGAAGIVRL